MSDRSGFRIPDTDLVVRDLIADTEASKVYRAWSDGMQRRSARSSLAGSTTMNDGAAK